MFAEAGNSVQRMPVHSVGPRSWFAMLFPMDVERIIHEIQQLEEMYEAPDIRPSIQAMSLLRIEGMMKPSPTVRGSGSGRILVSAAGQGIRCSKKLSDSKFPRFRQQPELRRCGLAFI